MEHEIITGNDIYAVTSILYPDGDPDMPNSSHHIERFLKEFPPDKYEIAFIYHDNDDVKKHCHIACRYKNGGTFSKARYMKSLGVSYNNCWKVDNWQSLIAYFLHRTNDTSDGKYKYPLTELYANFDISFLNNKILDNQKTSDEFEILLDLCDYLNANKGNWNKLIMYAGKNGYFKVLKSNQFLIDKQYKSTFHRYDVFKE